ncbi:MAG: pyridoxamine 5'-phosphate oxidase [Xanthomonadales bacterium]|nr:pyridoxamine 5'-phosphate oxidase [Xanthomonadales bacterium]
MDISDLRREYTFSGLQRESLCSSPYEQFEIWFSQATQAELETPNAFSLATVNTHGAPSVRTVLLKLFDQQGFVFFTNYSSHKARDIADNPNVAALFHWLEFDRQVKIEGRAEKISTNDSLKYFSSRPRGSQIGAWCSHQSRVVTSRSLLETQFQAIKEKFQHQEIPLPDFWGGFRIIPQSIEFWQGRENRLHDRFRFVREENDWRIKRLAP